MLYHSCKAMNILLPYVSQRRVYNIQFVIDFPVFKLTEVRRHLFEGELWKYLDGRACFDVCQNNCRKYCIKCSLFRGRQVVFELFKCRNSNFCFFPHIFCYYVGAILKAPREILSAILSYISGNVYFADSSFIAVKLEIILIKSVQSMQLKASGKYLLSFKRNCFSDKWLNWWIFLESLMSVLPYPSKLNNQTAGTGIERMLHLYFLISSCLIQGWDNSKSKFHFKLLFTNQTSQENFPEIHDGNL